MNAHQRREHRRNLARMVEALKLRNDLMYEGWACVKVLSQVTGNFIKTKSINYIWVEINDPYSIRQKYPGIKKIVHLRDLQVYKDDGYCASGKFHLFSKA